MSLVPKKHRLQSCPSLPFDSQVSMNGIGFAPVCCHPLGTQRFADELRIGRRQKKDDETRLSAVSDIAEMLAGGGAGNRDEMRTGVGRDVAD